MTVDYLDNTIDKLTIKLHAAVSQSFKESPIGKQAQTVDAAYLSLLFCLVEVMGFFDVPAEDKEKFLDDTVEKFSTYLRNAFKRPKPKLKPTTKKGVIIQ